MTDVGSDASAVAGQDAAIVALGSNGLRDKATLAAGTRNVVDGKTRHRVERLVVLSAAGAGESRRQISGLTDQMPRQRYRNGVYREVSKRTVIARELLNVVRPVPGANHYIHRLRVGVVLEVGLRAGVVRTADEPDSESDCPTRHFAQGRHPSGVRARRERNGVAVRAEKAAACFEGPDKRRTKTRAAHSRQCGVHRGIRPCYMTVTSLFSSSLSGTSRSRCRSRVHSYTRHVPIQLPQTRDARRGR